MDIFVADATKIHTSIAISFSRGSSQPKDQTRVSVIGGRLLTVQDTRKLVESFIQGSR